MAQAKKLMNGLKESAIGATETRFDAVKPLVVKLSELKSASSPKVNDSYVQALQSANTQNAFKYLDSLFELNTRGKLSRSEIEKLTVIPEKTEASLRCPTVALNSMTLFQFSSKDKAFALVDKYQEECMGQSMFTNAFSIASAEKQGDYIKAYQRAVKADELYDTPDFLIERVRLAKKSSTLDMASIRCTLEWGLHSIDKKPIERWCTEAESGSPGKWYQQFLR